VIRVHVYLHESLTRDRKLFTPVPMMPLELPAALHAYDRIGFAEDDPQPFTGRVLEVQRITWYTRPTDDGAWAEIHMRETTR
jgi:hypothetical protein